MNHLQIAATILSDAQRAETLGNTVSGKLLALFKECESAEAFADICKQAETDWKAKRAKAKADTNIPRCWSQAKSDILGAVKSGIDASQYDTVSSLKRAKIAASKAAKPVTAKAKGGSIVPSEVATVVVESDMTDEAINKAQHLLELLEQVGEVMRDSLLDAFIAQAERAVQASSDEVLGSDIDSQIAQLMQAV